jgi:hypothetical protein
MSRHHHFVVEFTDGLYLMFGSRKGPLYKARVFGSVSAAHSAANSQWLRHRAPIVKKYKVVKAGLITNP